MAMRIWGIDLGTHAVKVCALQSRFRGYAVERIDSAPVRREGEASLLAAQKAALAPLVGAPHPRPDAVVVALPGATAATHSVVLPAVDGKRLEQALAFEIEGLIPFELSDVSYDHQAIEQADGKTKLLVGVTRRPALDELLAALRELGADPRTVTLAPLALPSLLQGDGQVLGLRGKKARAEAAAREAEAGLELIVDIGHDRTCAAVREGSKVIFARAFDGGGAGLTRAVARDLGLDFAAAEALKHERGSLLEGADPALVVPLARGLEPIVRELRQILKLVASRSRRPLQKIWLGGGGSKLPGLGALLEREFGGTAAPLVLPSLGGEVPGALEPSTALAAALALSAHGRMRFNLRRGDQSFQGDFAKMRGKLGQVGALAASLLFLAGVWGYTQIHVLAVREKAIDEAVCASTKQAIGKCLRDINVARSSLMGGAASGATIPRLSALDLLTETTNRLDIEGAKITEMDVGLQQVDLHGEADSFETVDKVVGALKGWRCFQDVQRGRVQKERDGKTVEFNLEARNGCAGIGGDGA